MSNCRVCGKEAINNCLLGNHTCHVRCSIEVMRRSSTDIICKNCVANLARRAGIITIAQEKEFVDKLREQLQDSESLG